MRKFVYLTLAVATFLVSACSTTPDCLKHHAYMDAKTFPKLKSPPGLQVPKPDQDMQIPGIASGPVGHYKKAPATASPDNAAGRCLTTPPAMNMTPSGATQG